LREEKIIFTAINLKNRIYGQTMERHGQAGEKNCLRHPVYFNWLFDLHIFPEASPITI
jgi:hypothetical protein